MQSSSPHTTNQATLLAAEPQLFVRDFAASVAFYVDRLGFEVAFIYGAPPFYAQVFRGGARLNLRHADSPAFDPSFRVREPDALSATIVLNDAKALFLQYKERGIAFRQALKTEPWGARSFIVADPDGNLLMFADSGEAVGD